MPSPEEAVLSISADAAPMWGEAPLTVDFLGEATGGPPGLRCRWDFGDRSAPVHQLSARHTYANPGEYAAKFTVFGSGVSQSREIPISVSGGGFACEIEADPDIGVVPLTVRFHAVLHDDVPAPLSFQWDFGDGGVGVGNPTSHAYLVPGTFTATVAVTNGLGQTARGDVPIQVDAADVED
jgi:PKD repeat protein